MKTACLSSQSFTNSLGTLDSQRSQSERQRATQMQSWRTACTKRARPHIAPSD